MGPAAITQAPAQIFEIDRIARNEAFEARARGHFDAPRGALAKYREPQHSRRQYSESHQVSRDGMSRFV
jgi:hypothetical protein